jgi:predicted AAA+ superfamily ATPase
VEKKKNVGSRTYRSALLWLERSGLVNYCYNISEPVMPLKERVRYDSFKPYLFDTGILIRMMEPGVASEIISRDVYSNNGAIVENCIACAIRNLSHPLLFYERDDSTMELDFIYSDDGMVTALEVKSGRDRRSKSLRNICTIERKIPIGM